MKRVLQIGVLAAVFAGGIIMQAQTSDVQREGGGWAQQIIGTMTAARNLKVKTDMGSVHVQGGAQGNISYVIRMRVNYASSEEAARRKMEGLRFTYGRQGEWAVISGDCARNCPNNLSVDIQVTVPRSIELVKLDTGGGSVGVMGINGKVDAETGGGNMSMDDIGGSVVTNSGGGNVEIGSVGGDLNVETGGGGIRIRSVGGIIQASTGGGSVQIGSGKKSVTVETGGGAIEVTRCDEGLHVQTGGGTIELGNVGGPVTAETGGGSIRLSGATGMVKAETGGGNLVLSHLSGPVSAETGAGGITADFVGSLKGDSLLETNSGDITVWVPSNVAMTIRAAVEMGMQDAIRSDFSEIHVTRNGGEYGPSEVDAEGKINGGGALLKIRTSMGHIDIRRGSK